MVAKVGSAGHVIDSVIQYPQGGGKAEARQSEQNNEIKAERRDPTVSLKKSTDRIVKASEMEDGARTRNVSLNKGSNASVIQSNGAIDSADKVGSINRKDMELTQEAVKITVDDVNKKLAPTNTNVQFSYHEKTGRYSFKVLDNETGKILREVPPEKSLDMVAKMFEMVGILVDKKL